MAELYGIKVTSQSVRLNVDTGHYQCKKCDTSLIKCRALLMVETPRWSLVGQHKTLNNDPMCCLIISCVEKLRVLPRQRGSSWFLDITTINSAKIIPKIYKIPAKGKAAWLCSTQETRWSIKQRNVVQVLQSPAGGDEGGVSLSAKPPAVSYIKVCVLGSTQSEVADIVALRKVCLGSLNIKASSKCLLKMPP